MSSIINQIYDWLIRNISDVLAITGIVATLIQSYKAKTAAVAAKEASEETRKKMRAVETSVILQECLHDAENLLQRVDLENWESASDTAFRIRKNLIAVKASTNGSLSEDINSSLDETIVQIKIINETSDRAKHGSGKAVSKTRLASAIRSQIDVILEIQQHTINTLGQKHD